MKERQSGEVDSDRGRLCICACVGVYAQVNSAAQHSDGTGVCGGRRVGGQGSRGEYSGAAFSHDSYVMQSGALSTTASSFSHMNALYIAFI